MTGCYRSVHDEIDFPEFPLKAVADVKVEFKKRYALIPMVQTWIQTVTKNALIPHSTVEIGYHSFMYVVLMQKDLTKTFKKENYKFFYRVVGPEGNTIEEGEIKV